MKYGTVPSSWLAWADTWDASLLLGVVKHLEDKLIDPQKATPDQVKAAMRVLRLREGQMSNPKYDGDWELISGRGLCGDTCRMRVPGGWLYRERECASRDGATTAIALAFVPDRTREPRR